MYVHQAWKRKDKLITMSNITYHNKLDFSVGFAKERKKAELYMNYNYQNYGPLVNLPSSQQKECTKFIVDCINTNNNNQA